MKVDASGNVYVVGSTTSPDFPRTSPGQFKGNRDIFVTKLAPDGKTILYTTYLGEGESGGDEATAIVLGAAGDAYITGVISKFMLLGDAVYAVVAKLNSDGSVDFFNRVTDTTGIANEVVNDMAVDKNGNIYLAGWTDMDTIPIVNGFQSTPVSLEFGSGFLVQLDPRAERILYSTYIGSMGFSRANSVAVDKDGYAYVTGSSSEIPTTPDSFQPNLAGEGDAYVMKLDPRRSGLDAIVYSTYLGGHDEDSGKVILDTLLPTLCRGGGDLMLLLLEGVGAKHPVKMRIGKVSN